MLVTKIAGWVMSVWRLGALAVEAEIGDAEPENLVGEGEVPRHQLGVALRQVPAHADFLASHAGNMNAIFAIFSRLPVVLFPADPFGAPRSGYPIVSIRPPSAWADRASVAPRRARAQVKVGGRERSSQGRRRRNVGSAASVAARRPPPGPTRR